MSSKMDSKLTGMWVAFFTAAGIPSEVSATYALTFTENRIQNDMLLDLNKEYLKDMGIMRMGDVIAILRHAKQVHEHAARDKVLSSAGAVGAVGGVGKVPVAAVTGRTTVSQPASPASRILEHYTRNPTVPVPEPPSTSLTVKRKSNEIISPIESQVKKRLIRFENKPEVKEGGNKTVFARLGNNEATITKVVTSQNVVTSQKLVTNQPAKPIYARLGSKAADAAQENQIIPIPKDALKYEGILKSPPLPAPKNVTITTTKTSRKIFTMRADETPVSVKDKLALPKAKSVKFSSHIQYKEIEKVTKPKPKGTQIFNKPERRLTMPEGSATVKSRLGIKTVNNLTITKNVFNRLGEV